MSAFRVKTRQRERRGDHLERGVFSGGADEGNGSVLYIGKGGILLRFIEAMDLVDEEDSPLPVHAAAFPGFIDDAPQVGDPGCHCADGAEVRPGNAGDYIGEGGLAASRRTPEDQ